jgi:hypothetical protein
MLDELGEGFHGDKYDAQIALIDPSQSGKMAWASLIHWYATLVEGVGGDDDGLLDSEEIAERAKEEEKARKAFSKFAKIENGVLNIAVSEFGKMIESTGTTYCEEEHYRTLKELRKPGDKIHEPDFLAWYINWLFGDESESKDEDYAKDEGETDKGESSVNKKGLGSLFQVEKYYNVWLIFCNLMIPIMW